MANIRFGVDQFIATAPAALANARLGLVTSNVATTASGGESSRIALRNAGFNLGRLFGPEHSLAGTAADGAHVSDETDPATGLPVVSLYGDTMRPPAESLAGLDAVVFDIPDVGARFYTYIWTLSHVMEAAVQAGLPVYVLDRPNPISGDLNAAEGPILDEANLASFVGRWNIPIRYSLTIGELAKLWNAERKIGADLHVIPISGWSRRMHWPETGLPFGTLSPAMHSYETALLYPGTCLIEGTKLSEGRGTDAPFRLIGAPWINGEALADMMTAKKLPGIRAHAATFVPEGRKYSGERCGGVKLEITEARALRPVSVGLHLIHSIMQLHRDRFEWLPYPTAADRKGLQHFDRLVGRLDVRPKLEKSSDEDIGETVSGWTSVRQWRQRAEPHLLYE